MFDVWLLRWRRHQAFHTFLGTRVKLTVNELCSTNNPRLDMRLYSELTDAEDQVDWVLSNKLCQKAEKLDIVIPLFEDKTVWQELGRGDLLVLTHHGRLLVRRLIDEEKARRFEARMRWVRLMTQSFVPILGAAAGLVGAMIGWVAIHKK